VIEDPYGGDLDHYLTAYARIRRAVDSLLGALAGEAV